VALKTEDWDGSHSARHLFQLIARGGLKLLVTTMPFLTILGDVSCTTDAVLNAVFPHKTLPPSLPTT
jgi:hypothetical protein